ncbi:hypothetical protein Ocin01_18517 [Orchesella cincta]|uniref:Uncharacterized protein n=1 Tax=Orchesella cincta TaxID=48709 RepID=A0A1D2M5H5_ORCCI|nr:hypothetical protein Ocin01_18517 [Orchesella cincta]
MKAFVVLAVLGVATAAPQYGYGGDCYTWFLPPDFKEIPCKIELTHDVITLGGVGAVMGWSRRRIWAGVGGVMAQEEDMEVVGVPQWLPVVVCMTKVHLISLPTKDPTLTHMELKVPKEVPSTLQLPVWSCCPSQGSGLAARNAGASSNYGNKFGSSQTFGESYGNSNAYDNSLAAQQGSQAAAQYGQANSLNAAQGSQGSVGALNAGQYSNAAGSAMHNAGAGYGVVG